MTVPPLRTVTLACGRAAAFRRGGTAGGPVVVLLHGAGIDHSAFSWRPLLGDDAPFDLVAPNWPGDEGSTPFGRPYDTADAGAWLVAFLDAVGVDRAGLVGVSLGAGAALWAAIEHPRRVERVVAVGAFGVQPRAPAHELAYLAAHLRLTEAAFWAMRRWRWASWLGLAAVFGRPSRIEVEHVAEVRAGLRGRDEGRVFARYQRAEMGPRRLRTDLTPRLAGVAAPTLFVHGAADRLVPLDAVRRAASVMPDARVEVLDGGHLLTREAPDALWRVVRAFLRAPGAAAGLPASAARGKPHAAGP